MFNIMTKEEQIEAAWAQHYANDNTPTLPQGIAIGIRDMSQVKAPKVIFANREEIETCYRAWKERKDEAIRTRKAKKVQETMAAQVGKEYVNLADLQAAVK